MVKLEVLSSSWTYGGDPRRPAYRQMDTDKAYDQVIFLALTSGTWASGDPIRRSHSWYARKSTGQETLRLRQGSESTNLDSLEVLARRKHVSLC